MSLMMSSCCTLRLKRRRAFSIDSPSWTLISAKKSTPPDYLDWVEIKRLFPRGIAEDASHALETCQANIVVVLGDTPIVRPTRPSPQHRLYHNWNYIKGLYPTLRGRPHRACRPMRVAAVIPCRSRPDPRAKPCGKARRTRHGTPRPTTSASGPCSRTRAACGGWTHETTGPSSPESTRRPSDRNVYLGPTQN